MVAAPLKMLLFALFLQVGLTIALLLWLGRERVGSAGRKEVRIPDIALSSQAWPDRVKKIGNSYQNQFELPVLFYVAVMLAIVLSAVDWIVVGLAWVFVAMRVAHAAVHVTHNNVVLRLQVFSLGVVVVTALWIYLAFRLLLSGAL